MPFIPVYRNMSWLYLISCIFLVVVSIIETLFNLLDHLQEELSTHGLQMAISTWDNPSP